MVRLTLLAWEEAGPGFPRRTHVPPEPPAGHSGPTLFPGSRCTFLLMSGAIACAAPLWAVSCLFL